MSKTKKTDENLMDKVVSLAKRRGFIFPGSEIYGGLGGTWDYGPVGAALKNNVKRAWWREVVEKRDDIAGIDAAILMHPKTWEASGHVAGFSDPLVDCRACKRRFRADHLIDSLCPNCGKSDFTPARQFNLMFKTFVGPVEEAASQVWLRPETAQGIFVNFKNVLDTARKKIPFGIAQIGKAFRNEITPSNFTFRSREFEQMEIEYFVKPGTDKKWHEYWLDERMKWYERLGLSKDKLRLRAHSKDELSHYSKGTSDVEYLFPFGWSELEGIANRGDFDLTQHQKFSGRDLSYFDEETKERYLPYVIEPSAGADRATLAFLVDAYSEEKDKEGTRVVLKLHPKLAPVKAAVFPLLANKPDLVKKAREVYELLKEHFPAEWDDIGNIGKRYRRQDEIGTPWCVTVDFETFEDKKATVRDRDSMKQERIAIEELVDYFKSKLSD